MISNEQLTALAGKHVQGTGGEKIGKIVDVYESTDGGQEGTFVTVHTGLFGGRANFVPLSEASIEGDDVVVPYGKDLVKDAPHVEADQELTSQEEDRLYQHYSLTSGVRSTAPAAAPQQSVAAGTGTDTGQRESVGHDTSGPTTDDAMTRSEERLQVGTQQVETGRARLRKRIVTEQVSQTVPVSHQTATVTTEPITDANREKAMGGPELTESEYEVTLTGEQPVVAKQTVPVERVRLGTETVTEQQTVTEQVRKEQIELDGDTADASTDRR